MARPIQPKAPPRARQCAGLLSRLAFQHGSQHGIDTRALLRDAGLSVETIQDTSARIPIARQIQFVSLAADALHDDLLGFRLAKAVDFRELGWLYYVAASADSLADALFRLERYCHLNNEGLHLSVQAGPPMSVKLRYSGVRRYSDAHQMSCFIGVILFLARHVTAARLADADVRVAHRVPQKRELQRLLGCRVQDLARCDEVRFTATDIETPVVRADPYLHRLCVNACEATLAQTRVSRTGIRHHVENIIAELLPHGPVRQDEVASRMRMSSRTLARRLAQEDCVFSDLLRQVRLGLARHYLRDRSLSISEVAWLVGYSEVSTFSHAFLRWTGASPTTIRRPAALERINQTPARSKARAGARATGTARPVGP